MSEKEAKFLIEIMEFCGEEAVLHKDYSGRGMYGKTTCAVSFDHWILLVNCILQYFKETKDSIDYVDIPDFKTFKCDNLGRNIIIY